MRNKFRGGGGVFSGFFSLPPEPLKEEKEEVEEEKEEKEEVEEKVEEKEKEADVEEGHEDPNGMEFKNKFITLKEQKIQMANEIKLKQTATERDRDAAFSDNNQESVDLLHKEVLLHASALALLGYEIKEARNFRLVDDEFKLKFPEEYSKHVNRMAKNVGLARQKNKAIEKSGRSPVDAVEINKLENIDIDALANKVKAIIQGELQEKLTPKDVQFTDDSWMDDSSKTPTNKQKKRQPKPTTQPTPTTQPPPPTTQPPPPSPPPPPTTTPTYDDVGFESVGSSKIPDLKINIDSFNERLNDIKKIHDSLVKNKPKNISVAISNVKEHLLSVKEHLLSFEYERPDLLDFFIQSLRSELPEMKTTDDYPELAKQVLIGMLKQKTIPDDKLFNPLMNMKTRNCKLAYIIKSCKSVKTYVDLANLKFEVSLCFHLRWWLHLNHKQRGEDKDLIRAVSVLYENLPKDNSYNRKANQIIDIIGITVDNSDGGDTPITIKFKDDLGHLHQIFILDDLIKKIETTKGIEQKSISISYDGLFHINVKEVSGGRKRKTRKNKIRKRRSTSKKR